MFLRLSCTGVKAYLALIVIQFRACFSINFLEMGEKRYYKSWIADNSAIIEIPSIYYPSILLYFIPAGDFL